MLQYLYYLVYMFTGMLMTILFAIAYVRITPARELYLIQQGNLACALSLGGAIIGFCIALVSAMTHSFSLLNFVLWGLGASVVQIGVYFAASKIIRNVANELENNNVAVGAFCCALSIAIGLLNAACLVS
ncbi:DUF350 domain-containing protein [Wielerella bovis]|uniref:DUF350 domain-containing protein n=1 Tax=Wielerella bovis TaxID=2917790 RepID=UPI002018C014|nr:DUF350 domain-containing protein [Wielerella bovis]MCG7656690.1 DUF350 domain-containing protein [Wielerella bovis]MCG7658913.1 DUF350 domain-containing protein [Wielerella bovis]ULJ61104.1 DUF350 domain-containing protein [Wielerella bovis]